MNRAFRTLSIKFRDAKQALMGKTKLIQEYNDIVRAIGQEEKNIKFAIDNGISYENKSNLKAIKDDWLKLTEFDIVADTKNPNVATVENFDYYGASRKELEKKVEFGRKVLKKYNIKCPNNDLAKAVFISRQNNKNK